MRGTLCLILTVIPILGVGAANDVVLRGDHDEVLISVPHGWKQYGVPASTALRAISLVHANLQISGHAPPMASIRIKIGSSKDCPLSEKSAKPLNFGQKLVTGDIQRVQLNMGATTIFHTENDVADYYYACISLPHDKAIAIFTFAKGDRQLEYLSAFKADYLWTLGNLTLHK